FVALAEKYPKDPVAFDALVWVVNDDFGSSAGKPDQARAVELLIRDHVQNKKMEQVCQTLAFGMDQSGEKLLRAVLEKNKSKQAQAEACLALAQRLQQHAEVVRQVKDNAELAAQVESIFGKEMAAELKKSDPAKTEAESVKFFKRLTDRHLAD